MTLADYRKTLGRETSADTASDVGVAVSNGIDFQFANGMVIASFIGTSPSKITPNQKPIFVQIDPIFKGTVVVCTQAIPSRAPFTSFRADIAKIR